MELIIFGSLAGFCVYKLYKHWNPTLEDLIEKREREKYMMERNLEVGKYVLESMDKVTEWEDRCIAAGMMLPY